MGSGIPIVRKEILGLSLFQIRSDVRSKYSRMSEKKMLKMITPQCRSLYVNITKYKLLIPYYVVKINHVGSSGVISAQVHNPAVTRSLLNEIGQWKAEGCSDVDVITRLRLRTVPLGYEIHTWMAGSCLQFNIGNNLQLLQYYYRTRRN